MIVYSIFFYIISLKSLMSVSNDFHYHRKDLTGKVALVTGSTDGIGKHTALLLAESNALVLLHGRSYDRLERSKYDILAKYPSALLETYCYDLETIEETIKFCNDIKSKHENLDILINNAGVFETKRKITKDNIEKTFAINVVATYILCCSLYSILNKTKHSRILNVSSISQSDIGSIDLDNLQFEKGGYSSFNSYSLSKLCIAAISYELSLRISHNDVLVMSCDPGILLYTNNEIISLDLVYYNHMFYIIIEA